jgi:hypothetical protein
MNGYLKWLAPSVLVLAFSAGAYAESSSKLDNRVGSPQKPVEQEEKSRKQTAKEAEKQEQEEANLDIHGAGTKVEGKVAPNERKRSNRESNKMGKQIQRQKNSAAAPMSPQKDSIPIDPN